MSGAVVWQLLIILLLVAVVFEGLLLIGVMRQVGGLLLRLPAPRPGTTEGGPETGSPVDVDDLRAQPGVLLFLSPGCSLCDDLVPGLPSLEKHFPELQLIAVPLSADDQVRAEYAKTLPIRTRSDLRDLRAQWSIEGTPYAVGFDSDLRVVGSGVVNNVEQVEALGVSASRGLGVPEEATPPGAGPSNGVAALEVQQVAAGDHALPEGEDSDGSN